jgi:hypothetical protein
MDPQMVWDMMDEYEHQQLDDDTRSKSTARQDQAETKKQEASSRKSSPFMGFRAFGR